MELATRPSTSLRDRVHALETRSSRTETDPVGIGGIRETSEQESIQSVFDDRDE
ncbi:hypothetical protein [Natrialba aegyptia]|uniref:hypothetical protein n=1 Tax=Natrialba aegyptia TaxID=129789 RepID=UPI000AA0AF52|nr:hypothetical protein [Natrialba aegyptia]